MPDLVHGISPFLAFRRSVSGLMPNCAAFSSVVKVFFIGKRLSSSSHITFRITSINSAISLEIFLLELSAFHIHHFWGEESARMETLQSDVSLLLVFDSFS